MKKLQIIIICLIQLVIVGCKTTEPPKKEWTVEQYVKKLDYFLEDNCFDNALIIVHEKSDWFIGRIELGKDDVFIRKNTSRVVYAFDESPLSGDMIINWNFLYEADYTMFWEFILNRNNKRENIFYIARCPENLVPVEKIVMEEHIYKIAQQCYVSDDFLPWPFSMAFEWSIDEEGLREIPEIFELDKAIVAYLILRERYRNEKMAKQLKEYEDDARVVEFEITLQSGK